MRRDLVRASRDHRPRFGRGLSFRHTSSLMVALARFAVETCLPVSLVGWMLAGRFVAEKEEVAVPASALHHVDLAVEDMDRSVAFYTGPLGP